MMVVVEKSLKAWFLIIMFYTIWSPKRTFLIVYAGKVLNLMLNKKKILRRMYILVNETLIASPKKIKLSGMLSLLFCQVHIFRKDRAKFTQQESIGSPHV